ncbi:MAG: hypothetical protein MUE77_04080 [Sandarakinorhabdus sp.]|nr:hypothetical protein [Sandarakinorhabdus sp.]
MIRLALIAAALVAAGPVVAQEAAAPDKPETASCLPTRNILQAYAGIDGKWYARVSGSKWWRNTMECPTLQPRRGVVHNSPIGSQCRGDIVQVVDFNLGGVNFGGCALDTWERVDKPAPQRAPKSAKPR